VVDPTALVVASQSRTSHARSALPHARVIDLPAQSRPARPKSAAAALLRRFAARLDPSYEGEAPCMPPSAGTG
jgi:hypothetical protein